MTIGIFLPGCSCKVIIAEIDRYDFCCIRKTCNLRIQEKYILQEGFRDSDGVKIQAITYAADQVYEDKDGNLTDDYEENK